MHVIVLYLYKRRCEDEKENKVEKYYGLLTLILILISLSNGRIEAELLEEYLSKLDLKQFYSEEISDFIKKKYQI